MSLLFALNRLESHLRTLVEGSLARLFPAPNLRQELIQHLVLALRQEARRSADGRVLAPDRFTIFLPPSQATALASLPDLLVELAQDLSQAAAEAGVIFTTPPSVRVLPEREALDQISVLSQFTLAEAFQETHGTAALPLPESRGPAVSETLPPTDHAPFLLLENGRVFPLATGVVNLGSAPQNQLFLPDARLAPLHAQIRLAQGACTLFNLASPGSTTVNDIPVSQRALQPGDVISLGGLRLIFVHETLSDFPEDTQPLP